MRRIVTVLAKIFKPLPLITILSAVFSILIYVLGHKIGMRGIYPFRSDDVRVWSSILLAIIALILAIVLLARWIKAIRDKRQQLAKREPTIEEIETKAMDDVFQTATQVIRNRWSGTGRRIYGLPWYLVLGKKSSGKTGLIDNGDMRFPIDHEIAAELKALNDHDAAHFISWRVSGNEAVLLDISGDYFVPHEDRSSLQSVLWDRFLYNLQKYRPRRPINGVLLTIDTSEFTQMSLTEREAYSSLVRHTINDLVERLGTQMTIHIAFTKMDQVSGFADFFEGLNAVEREELFGFHFLYEGKHTPSWFSQFNEQYDAFLERLQMYTNKRLLELRSVMARHEAFSFQRTFIGLQAPLRTFLESALSPDKFSTPPLVRGLYFTSSRQENVPQNVFLESVGERYQLPSPLYGASQGNSFSYFVTSLFKKAVFTEAGLAGNNQKVEQLYEKRAFITSVFAVLFCLGGGIYWSYKYNQNLQLGQNVLNTTREFASIDADKKNDSTGRQLLSPLNTIRDATFEFGDYRNINAVKSQLTLYQGKEVGPIADAAYKKVLNTEFVPVLVRGIAENLKNVCPKGSDQELDLLRVYRMLGALEGRDARIIDKYFRTYWQKEFEAEGGIQNELNEHLTYALNVVPEAYDIDQNLVRSAQTNLGQLTPYRRVYSSLRSLSERQFPNPLEFRSSVGATFDIVYEPVTQRQDQKDQKAPASDNTCGHISEQTFELGLFEISRLFTKKMFHDFFIPQNEQVAKVAADDLWVLGQLEDTDYSDEDYSQIQSKVREIYINEYIQAWRTTLNSLKVREFKDLRDATEILRGFSGTDNPIRRIAQLVATNTVIYEEKSVVLEGTEESATELPFDPNREAGLLINDSFADIRRMLDDNQEGTLPNIEQIQEALIAVHDYVQTIQDSPNPNEKALELAIQRASLQGDDPIYVLRRIAERTPAPFDQHLKDVAQNSWRIVMEAATDELNRKWHDEIYGDYQRLIAGKYPFSRTSEVDLPIEDFEEFFKPNGILQTFYEKELLIFVNEATEEPRIIDGERLAVDKEFAGKLRKAINISETFFDASGQLSVEFKIATAGMSSNLSRAVLNFEGQLVINSHGPSRPITIVWPNIIDGPASSRVDLSTLRSSGKNLSLAFDGSWSWLRLYDRAEKSNFTNNSVDITFGNVNNQSATFRLRAESGVNPFFNSPLSGFSLPSHLRTKSGS